MKPRGSSPSASKQCSSPPADVDDVAGPDLVRVVAERDPRAAGLDHDAVVVRVALARGAPARRHVEVADAVVGRAVGRADQLVLLDARERRVVVGLRPRRPPSRVADRRWTVPMVV